MKATIRALSVSLALALSLNASPATAPREVRVAIVGDSLAYGAGDETGKGIAGRLEPELRRFGIESIVATNLGATGATTRDLQARLREGDAHAAVARANAIVLSIGANDLRLPLMGEEPLRSPLRIVDQVLRNIDTIVSELRRTNPNARILILGGYAPVPHQRAAVIFEPLVALWDAALMAQFAHDPLISVIRLSDIVDRPERLSTLDSFHPGGEAYQEAARRIAELLASERS